jgi:lipopolysaccharide biosynthesis glycosyltransferase
MSKNLIFMPAYNGFDKYLPSIQSWKYYCKKNNIELIIANEKRNYDFNDWGNGCYEPWWDDRLVNIDYEKVILIDADTVVRWDAPNIFEVCKDVEIGVVCDAGGESTGRYHLNQWEDLNPNIKTPNDKYFNTGFVLLSKEKYLGIREEMPRYYEFWASFFKNNIKGPDACEQTAVNILAYELYENEVTHLDFKWNNMVMAKYDDGSFINDSYIWHFTGFKMGGHKNKGNIMNQTWDYIKEYYE